MDRDEGEDDTRGNKAIKAIALVLKRASYYTVVGPAQDIDCTHIVLKKSVGRDVFLLVDHAKCMQL